jgi:hypothetical protein
VIGARVGEHAGAKAEQRPVRGGGGLDLDAPLAGVRGGRQVLASRLEPLHRTSGPARESGHRQILGHHVHLLAEAAPGVGHDHPHPRLGQTEGPRHPDAEDVRDLAAGPERERVTLPAGDQAPGLERRRRAARVAERLPDDHGGGGEGRVHVALASPPLEEDVGVQLGMETRGSRRQRAHDIGHRGQRLTLHRHELGGIGGGVGRAGGHRGHRLAHEARARDDERGPAGRHEARRVEPRLERGHVVGQVRAGEEHRHPGRASRRLRVDPDEPRVRVGAPDEGGVKEPGEREVVEIAPLAGQQPRILEPLHVGAQVARRGRSQGRLPVMEPRREAAPRRPAARAAPRPS